MGHVIRAGAIAGARDTEAPVSSLEQGLKTEFFHHDLRQALCLSLCFLPEINKSNALRQGQDCMASNSDVNGLLLFAL